MVPTPVSQCFAAKVDLNAVPIMQLHYKSGKRLRKAV